MGNALLSNAVRGWLVFTSLFEVPLIYSCIAQNADGSRLAGLYSNLEKSSRSPAARRLVAFALSVLVVARISAAAEVDNATIQTQNAIIHLIEAIYFGKEALLHKARGEKAILGAIFAQAALYCYWASRCSTTTTE